MNVAEVGGQLGGQWARHELRKRQALLVIRFRNPFPSLDQIAVHVTDECHRAAESQGTQLQRVPKQLTERVDRGVIPVGRFGCGITTLSSEATVARWLVGEHVF